MWLSLTDAGFRAEVLQDGSRQFIRIWLWSFEENAWVHSADVNNPEELARFVDLGSLFEVADFTTY